MRQPVVQVDAFTDQPFGGNPAAVCVLAAPREEAWMRAVAAEMNLAETAFLVREEAGGWHLRWFTPTVEVDLCGHATLASAHVLWEEGHLGAHDEARFRTRSGTLGARRDGGLIWLDFPVLAPVEAAAPPRLLEGLGVGEGAVYVGRNRDDWMVALRSEAEVRALRPDLAALGEVPCRGVIVTAPSGATTCDFVSRFFGPRVGVPEDPVTGSAHTCLAPYWAERLGRTELVGYQASARGGFVRVRLEGERVGLGGSAVTVVRGELLA